jgi:hypothetical protein
LAGSTEHSEACQKKKEVEISFDLETKKNWALFTDYNFAIRNLKKKGQNVGVYAKKNANS